MKTLNRNVFVGTAKVILAVLILVIIVRTFFVESYTISSDQMDASLLAGDAVFVNKTAYGVRMPMTPLSIPFVFDNILGIKTYSRLIELPYERLCEMRIAQNDIVLFNNPFECNKPIDRRTLHVSRCIGLPGDTLEGRTDGLFVNGKEYVFSPNYVRRYEFATSRFDSIVALSSHLDIPMRSLKKCGNSTSLLLSNFEYYLLASNFSNSIIYPSAVSDFNFDFVIPHEGMNIKLTPKNVVVYGRAILEDDHEVSLRDGAFYKNGAVLDSYMFAKDFYWFLSDNSEHLSDSRSFGFIPVSHVVGRIWTIWYSADNGDKRWNRCFISLR